MNGGSWHRSWPRIHGKLPELHAGMVEAHFSWESELSNHNSNLSVFCDLPKEQQTGQGKIHQQCAGNSVPSILQRLAQQQKQNSEGWDSWAAHRKGISVDLLTLVSGRPSSLPIHPENSWQFHAPVRRILREMQTMHSQTEQRREDLGW